MESNMTNAYEHTSYCIYVFFWCAAHNFNVSVIKTFPTTAILYVADARIMGYFECCNKQSMVAV